MGGARLAGCGLADRPEGAPSRRGLDRGRDPHLRVGLVEEADDFAIRAAPAEDLHGRVVNLAWGIPLELN